MASGPQATVGVLQVGSLSQVATVVFLLHTWDSLPAGRALVEVGQTAGKARQLRGGQSREVEESGEEVWTACLKPEQAWAHS